MNSDKHFNIKKINNEQYFKALFDQYYTPLVQHAYFYTKDLQTSEDIVQDIFVKLWDKRKEIKVEHIKTYLFNSVRNKSLNHLEHLQVENKYFNEYLTQLKTEDAEEIEEYIKFIGELLDKLPEKRKTILKMSVLDSMTYQQIADGLGISVNTVKDHIKKAYSFLREQSKKDIPPFILFFAYYFKK